MTENQRSQNLTEQTFSYIISLHIESPQKRHHEPSIMTKSELKSVIGGQTKGCLMDKEDGAIESRKTMTQL